MLPREHIQEIRNKYTGEHIPNLATEERLVISNLSGSLSSAIDELATNIYTKENHFLMELIQNADDNDYQKGTEPKLDLIRYSDKLIIRNNEIGFSRQNVEAICAIKKSTKKITADYKGYIGEKGIGFKSVFRVSDAPEIHSNGYHFRFYSKKATKGEKVAFILPEWIDQIDALANASQTRILLPLRKSFQIEITNQLSDVQSNLLLFLNKIKVISIDNRVTGIRTEFIKKLKGPYLTVTTTRFKNQVLEYKSSKKYFLYERTLTKIPPKALTEQRKNVRSTRIVIAFPIDAKGNVLASNREEVYAFLPVGKYGFGFTVQADFILTSGRESIATDNPWNVWLQQELVLTFKQAVEVLKKEDKLQSSFLACFPKPNEISNAFFKKVAINLLEELSNLNIVRSFSHEWIKPKQAVLFNKEQSVIFNNILLKSVLKKEYTDPGLDIYKATLLKLGVFELQREEQLKCVSNSKLLHNYKNEWFVNLVSYFSRSDECFEIAETLKDYAILPLQTGDENKIRLVAPGKQTVFFELDKKTSYSFESTIPILAHPFFNKISSVKNSAHKVEIRTFLEGLGVQTAKPAAIIINYILPLYQNGNSNKLSSSSRADHIFYLKNHLPSFTKNKANLEAQLKNLLKIKVITADGTRTSELEPPLCFIPSWYGNKYKPDKLFKQHAGSLFIDPYYLKLEKAISKKEKETKEKEWFRFFKAIGCQEIPILNEVGNNRYLTRAIQQRDTDSASLIIKMINDNWYDFEKFAKKNPKPDWYNWLANEKAFPVGNKFYKGWQVFEKTKDLQSVFGKGLPYYKENFEFGFINLFKINSSPTKKACINYLRFLSENGEVLPEKKALDIYGRLFFETDFSDFSIYPIIYLPYSKKWWRSRDVIWNDYSRLLGNSYGYLSKAFPPTFKSFFVEKLHVAEQPDVDQLLEILEQLNSGEESAVDPTNTKKTFERIFKEISEQFKKELVNGDHLEKLNEQLFTKRNEFWKNEQDIYYDNNPELYNLFKEESSIAFIALEVNILPKTKVLLDALGIPSVTEAVEQTCVNSEHASLDEKTTQKIRYYTDTLLNMIYAHHTKIFDEQGKETLLLKLRNIEIIEVPDLEVAYRLNGIVRTKKADSLTTGNQIVIDKDCANKHLAIAFKIEKMFDVPFAEFIHFILGSGTDTIRQLILLRNLVSPPEEESYEDIDNIGAVFIETTATKTKETDNQPIIVQLSSVDESTASWAPSIPVEETILSIEAYNGRDLIPMSADQEGASLQGNPLDWGSGIRVSNPLPEADRIALGNFGEALAYRALKQSLLDKYTDCETEENMEKNEFCIYREQGLVAQLKWLNDRESTQVGYDLTLKENETKRFIEVKTSTSYRALPFEVTASQIQFMQGKGEDYSIFRITVTDSKQPEIKDIRNPYKLWQEGRLKINKLSVEL